MKKGARKCVCWRGEGIETFVCSLSYNYACNCSVIHTSSNVCDVVMYEFQRYSNFSTSETMVAVLVKLQDGNAA